MDNKIWLASFIILALALAPTALAVDYTTDTLTYWKFDGDGTDESTNNNDVNNKTYLSGHLGDALFLDSAAPSLYDDYTYLTSFNYPIAKTIDAWYYKNSSAVSNTPLAMESNSGDFQVGMNVVRTNSSHTRIQHILNGDEESWVHHGYTPYVSASDDAWHHVVMTWGEGYLEIYHDGSLLMNNSAADIDYSGASSVETYVVRGQVDNLIMTTSHYSPADVTASYNSGAGTEFVVVAPVDTCPGIAAGTGTVGDPCIITTPAEFNAMRDNLTAYYELGNDIDMAGATWDGPVGDWAVAAFTGAFDGKGYSVDNMHWVWVGDTGDFPAGIFGVVDTPAWIRNVNFDNYSLTNTADGGVSCCGAGFIGGSDGSSDWDLSNVHFTNAIYNALNGTDAAGIINYGLTEFTAVNVSFEGDVYGAWAVGGLSAYQINFEDSYFVGNLYLNTSVKTTNAGGLFGKAEAMVNAHINNSYALANISILGTKVFAVNTGGLAGTVNSAINITDSYFYGSLPANADVANNIMINSSPSQGTCEGVYYYNTTVFTTDSSGCAGASFVAEDDWDVEGSFTGFDFGTVWAVDYLSTPKFLWQNYTEVPLVPMTVTSVAPANDTIIYTLEENFSANLTDAYNGAYSCDLEVNGSVVDSTVVATGDNQYSNFNAKSQKRNYVNQTFIAQGDYITHINDPTQSSLSYTYRLYKGDFRSDTLVHVYDYVSPGAPEDAFAMYAVPHIAVENGATYTWELPVDGFYMSAFGNIDPNSWVSHDHGVAIQQSNEALAIRMNFKVNESEPIASFEDVDLNAFYENGEQEWNVACSAISEPTDNSTSETRVFEVRDPWGIYEATAITMSGNYTVKNNFTGSITVNNIPDVTIDAGEFGFSGVYVQQNGADNFILNGGILTSVGSGIPLNFYNGPDNILINGTIAIVGGTGAHAMKVDVGTVDGLTINNVELTAHGNSFSDALMIYSTVNNFVLTNSILDGAEMDLYMQGAGTGAVISNNVFRHVSNTKLRARVNAEIYNNTFIGGGSDLTMTDTGAEVYDNNFVSTVTFTGTASGVVYDNVFNTSALTFDSASVYLNQSTTGNTWTNSSATGFSDTCTNDWSNVCTETYTIGSATDYYPVAFSTPIPMTVTADAPANNTPMVPATTLDFSVDEYAGMNNSCYVAIDGVAGVTKQLYQIGTESTYSGGSQVYQAVYATGDMLVSITNPMLNGWGAYKPVVRTGNYYSAPIIGECDVAPASTLGDLIECNVPTTAGVKHFISFDKYEHTGNWGVQIGTATDPSHNQDSQSYGYGLVMDMNFVNTTAVGYNTSGSFDVESTLTPFIDDGLNHTWAVSCVDDAVPANTATSETRTMQVLDPWGIYECVTIGAGNWTMKNDISAVPNQNGACIQITGAVNLDMAGYDLEAYGTNTPIAMFFTGPGTGVVNGNGGSMHTKDSTHITGKGYDIYGSLSGVTIANVTLIADEPGAVFGIRTNGLQSNLVVDNVTFEGIGVAFSLSNHGNTNVVFKNNFVNTLYQHGFPTTTGISVYNNVYNTSSTGIYITAGSNGVNEIYGNTFLAYPGKIYPDVQLNNVAADVYDNYFYGTNSIILDGTNDAGNFYNNYFAASNATLIAVAGAEATFYNNVFNTTATFDGSENISLDNGSVGNTWTNPGQTGHSDTCNNNWYNMCVEEYIIGSTSDSYAVALSTPIAAAVTINYPTDASTITDVDTLFNFSVTGYTAPYECSLYIDGNDLGVVSGVTGSATADVTATITPLHDTGVHNVSVNCTGSNPADTTAQVTNDFSVFDWNLEPLFTQAYACPSEFPNEDNLPAAAEFQIEFNAWSGPGFTTPTIDITLTNGDVKTIDEASCGYVEHNSQNRTYTCNVSMDYWNDAGAYDAQINMSDAAESDSDTASGLCTYGTLVASKRTVDTITFPGAAPGVANIVGSPAMNIRNTGNVDLDLGMTAKTLTGRTDAGETLNANTFKAGDVLGSAVTMENEINKDLNMALVAASAAEDDIFLWLSMPLTNTPQEYFSTNSWELHATG